MIARAPAPPTVRAAALLLFLYGVLVVVGAAVMHTLGGGVDAADWADALVRLAGMAVLARGLRRLRRWAWWISVLLGAFWIIVAGFAAVVFATTDALSLLPLPTLSVTLMAGSILLLGGALACLLSGSARTAFRRSS